MDRQEWLGQSGQGNGRSDRRDCGVITESSGGAQQRYDMLLQAFEGSRGHGVGNALKEQRQTPGTSQEPESVDPIRSKWWAPAGMAAQSRKHLRARSCEDGCVVDGGKGRAKCKGKNDPKTYHRSCCRL